MDGRVNEADHTAEATPLHDWPQPLLSSLWGASQIEGGFGGLYRVDRALLGSQMAFPCFWLCSHALSPFQKETLESGHLNLMVQLPLPKT